MRQSELKPCPFCGGPAILCKDFEYGEYYDEYKLAYVKCDECGANTGTYIIDGHYGTNTTVKDAIDAWNRRHNETNK